jgi:RNA polymerase sigma-70 factor (ECF subfamily)
MRRILTVCGVSRTLPQSVRKPSTLCIILRMAIDLKDPDVFAAAFRRHERSVYAAAFRVLGDGARAHDVVQDVFLRVWRRPRSFDATRGELGSYLRLMARSRALDLWREDQAAGRASDRLKVVVADAELPVDGRPAEATERADAAAAIRAALRRLPDTQREALVLAYWGGLTTDEIARRSRVPLGTAKSRIRIGLEKLRRECDRAHTAGLDVSLA